MKLDSNLAWKDALAALSANREVMAAIAGVFFLLPSLAFGLFVEQPEPAPGIGAEQAMAIASDFYVSAMPFMVPMFVLQAIGTLAVLTLCTDRSRPTVGEAIRQGLTGLLPYFGASLLIGFAFGMAAVALVAIAALTQSPVVAAFAVTAAIAGAIYLSLRFSLVAPAVAVERLRNPVTALQRSWALTAGNAGKILLFVLLIAIVYLVLTIVASAIVGAVLALALGAEGAKTGSIVLSSILGAGFTLVFAAVLAAIHRQLAGPSPETIGSTFD